MDVAGGSATAPAGDAAAGLDRDRSALNAICPYYTMFPLAFPLAELRGAGEGPVLDPFCGRGTTLFAARLAGLPSLGIDSNPVAVAVSRGKLGGASAGAVVALARRILRTSDPDPAPEGPFWPMAFAPGALDAVLRLRAGLRDRDGAVADALRAVVLGALHGPRGRTMDSYLSNQMPRTFAYKPDYSMRFWSGRNLVPPDVDALAVIARRAYRFFGTPVPGPRGAAILGDARHVALPHRRFGHVVTSPPYFGMRTYVPDQWLRNWFLGGPPAPSYGLPGQIGYDGNRDPAVFANELAAVWANVAPACRDGARMAVRFGAIRSKPCDPAAVLRASIEAAGAGWVVEEVRPAGDAHGGRRQADQMGERGRGEGAVAEIDVLCRMVRRRASRVPACVGPR